MKLKEHLNSMTSYEKAKLVCDTMRFFATAAAPFITVLLGFYAKHILGW